MQEQGDMSTAENAGVTTRKPETISEETLNAIEASLSEFKISDDEQNGEDEEDDEEYTELGKPSDDEPGCGMGKSSKTVHHRVESFRQKQMRRDELT